MTSLDLQKYLEWDYLAWGEALKYWDSILPTSLKGKKVLELGGRNGGLSTYFAQKGAEVFCSDINSPTHLAQQTHKKLNLTNISYHAIDATKLSYKNEFDIIVFKSILGGIGYNNNIAAQKKALSSCYQALKPGGKLLFAENGKGSIFHKILRTFLTPWGRSWRYLGHKELKIFLEDEGFNVEIKSFGFFSIFSRNLNVKEVLLDIDKRLNSIIPNEKKYIHYGTARK
ncbi:MAG: SAM-dependent methyltransferase [Halobacteriovoraceae bacterium]|nr:SAM-dependent methyltransferase [Halobacteriovoraceae bacterium]